MTNLRFLPLAGIMALSLMACGQTDDTLHPDDAALLSEPDASIAPAADAGSAAPAAAQTAPATAQQVTLAANALAVGSGLGADGAVTGAQASYAPTSTIHASVPVGGYSPGTEVTLYWFGPDGTSVKTEAKPIPNGASFVSFSLGPDAKLTGGSYTAQADVGETPVGMVDFVVQ